MDTFFEWLKWLVLCLLTVGFVIFFAMSSEDSPRQNKPKVDEDEDDMEYHSSTKVPKQSKDEVYDPADNPYTDEDDFSFREPGWHPGPHRYREEDRDSL